MSSELYNRKEILGSMYKYNLIKTPEFEEWYEEQPLKSKFQIDDRLLHIAQMATLGFIRI